MCHYVEGGLQWCSTRTCLSLALLSTVFNDLDEDVGCVFLGTLDNTH